MDSKSKKKLLSTKFIRVLGLIIFDIIIIAAATFLAMFMRFDFRFSSIPAQYFTSWLHLVPAVTVAGIIVFTLFGLYNSLWQFAGLEEIGRIITSSFVLALLHFTVGSIFRINMPLSCYIIEFLLLTLFVTAVRFSYRIIRFLKHNFFSGKLYQSKQKNIMVIGAGEAGCMMINEINQNSHFSGENVACVIDDDTSKTGSYISRVKIVGTRKYILAAVKKYNIDVIIFAVPSMESEEKQKILSICKQTECELKTLPSMYSIINNGFSATSVRKVEIEDLLFRDPIISDIEKSRASVHGKTVLVTGGGGSIGSELCRQIALSKPKQLIIFDICENGAYDIQMELRESHPELNLVTLIGSVRDTKRINSVFEQYHPDIVFHAAAHKHVPLMEDSPNESVKNNVFGTLKTVQAADKFGTEKFVLISTDKAVNPTNIMGATKRVCEMIVQSYNARSKTDFVAVRFGNVLGSSGSVIPLFKKQIAHGGPITVTHPDIIRYFMTIPEAVSLVMQAGAYAKGGEIFVLDMGKPVKIVDLAENLICLSGYVPYEDIDIVFSGLRPGEKLYEELLMDEEGLSETDNKLIHIGKPIVFNETELFDKLSKLYKLMMDDTIDIRSYIQDIVPTYTPKPNKPQISETKANIAEAEASEKELVNA